MMLVFAFTIFLAAFLLFQVQPLISRYILPWFGGAPAVWSTSMLFFQVALLAGYAYAHWLVARSPRRQPLVHLLLLTGSLLLASAAASAWGTPLLPDASWKPFDPGQPWLRILILLTAGVGLPFFLLASTSPLLQSWFRSLTPGRSPYLLYALSNTGSLLALVTYPAIVEPVLALRTQAWVWAGGYLLFTVLAGLLAAYMRRGAQRGMPVSPPQHLSNIGGGSGPRSFHRFMWLMLSACASILLLAVTNQLSQEVAVIPFLWVLPLSLYLLSFIITFSGERWYNPRLLVSLLGGLTLLLAYVRLQYATLDVSLQVLLYSAFLFVGALVCHGELYRLRPEPARLTSFYLFVSLGGALGGLFVNFAAPVLFSGFWELQAGVLLCWLLLLALRLAGAQDIPGAWLRLSPAMLILALTAGLFFAEFRRSATGVLETHRNFYGVFRVRLLGVGEPQELAVELTHGITTHGFQFLDPEKKGIPTTYFDANSGAGLALTYYRPAAQRKIGVIGLGVATLAAYGRPEDTFRFYEINPEIISLAEGQGGHFSFLRDTQAGYEIIPGDARISLERELSQGQPQTFDILVLDAFSGDSIPVHLLTAEAFDLYLQHLRPGGVLAVHISNRYLDLTPVVQLQARRLGLTSALIHHPSDGPHSYTSRWVLLSAEEDFLAIPQIAAVWAPAPLSLPPVRMWTDDYSNLFQVIRGNPFQAGLLPISSLASGE